MKDIIDVVSEKDVEEWRRIILNDSYIGYSVSNFGDVRDDSNNRILPVIGKGDSGNLSVEVIINDEPVRLFIHELVATAFIPNPMNKERINHKDLNLENNCVANLEWMNGSEMMEKLLYQFEKIDKIPKMKL